MKLGSDEDDDETWLWEDLRSCEEVEGSRSLLPVIYSRYLPIVVDDFKGFCRYLDWKDVLLAEKACLLCLWEVKNVTSGGSFRCG